jgi:hypothetical protein
MRWSEHIARMEDIRKSYILDGISEGKRPLVDLDVGGTVILKFVLRKQKGRIGLC